MMNKRLDEIKELYSKKYMTKLYLRSSITDLLSYIEKLEAVVEEARIVYGFTKDVGLKQALSSLDAPAKKEKPDNEGGK